MSTIVDRAAGWIRPKIPSTFKGIVRPPTPATKREIPLVSGALPVLGHTVEFVRDTLGLLDRAYRECGEVAELQVAHKRMVLMTGPEAAEAFYRAPDEQLSPNAAYKMMVPVFGKDVVYDAHPAKMNEQMRMLLPALRDKRMRTYGEIIADEVRQSLESWGDSGVLDIADYTRVLTNFTSSHCLLGKEFRQDMTGEFAQVYHDLERGITPAAYIHPHLPLPAFRKRDRARVRLVEMITGIVAERRKSGREGEDFLQTLMDANYQSGEPLSEHEITGMLLAAMFAGHHTSSVTTAWCMLELLRNPGYLERMVAQIDEVYAGTDEISYQSLRDITLTDWAVKEALRLHPPLFMLLRGVLQDFEFGDHLIPAGYFVINSPLISHQLPHVYKNPERFDPERFGPEREEDKANFTYLSFGAGRHKCLGNAFALLQVKTIFAILLREYTFESMGDPVEPEFGGVVLGPKQPCRVRYTRRKR